MNDTPKRREAPFLLLFFFAAIVATAFRLVGILRESDVFIKLTGYVTAAAVALLLSYIFIGRKCTVTPPDLRKTGLSVIPSALVSMALVYLACNTFKRALPYLGRAKATAGKYSVFFASFGICAAVLALLSVGYFLLLKLVDAKENDLRGWFGMAAALCFAVYAIFLYFDITRPINDAGKILNQVTYLSFAVTMLFEVRFSIGKDKPAAYLALTLASSLLAAVDGVPALIYYLKEGEPLALSLAETVVTLAMLLCLLMRIPEILSPAPRKPEGVCAAIAKAERESADAAAQSDESEEQP